MQSNCDDKPSSVRKIIRINYQILKLGVITYSNTHLSLRASGHVVAYCNSNT